MTTEELQGSDGAVSLLKGDRFSTPFADYASPEDGAFEAIGYLLRLPSFGGHWVALLNGARMRPAHQDDTVAFLCDSMYQWPFSLTLTEVGDLLQASALDGASQAAVEYRDFAPRWCCWLLGIASPSAPVSMFDRWQDEIL